MTMMKPGDRVRTLSGKDHLIDRPIGCGSQAEVYLLRGGRWVYKRFVNRDELERVRWLHDQGLPADLPLCLPVDLVDQVEHAGYIANFVEGITLAEYLDTPGLSYGDTARAAHSLMFNLSRIHEHLAHGDVREENVIVKVRRDATGEFLIERLTFIDADNYAASGAPLPMYLGDNMVMAPELRATKDPRFVSRAADVYAGAQICHRMLLRHDDSCFAATSEEFEQAMRAGVWHSDIFNANRRDTGLDGHGLPADMLDSVTASMIRAAVQGDPALRPSARQFADHLGNMLDQQRIVHCPHCHMPMMLEQGVTRCVYRACGLPFDMPHVVLPSGHKLALAGAIVLGRDQLGSDRVSRRHLLLRRAGPLVCVRDLGSSNGTAVRTSPHEAWERLPAHAEVYLTPHPTQSLVRVAGVEVGLTF